jgi:hypothetical protein
MIVSLIDVRFELQKGSCLVKPGFDLAQVDLPAVTQ